MTKILMIDPCQHCRMTYSQVMYEAGHQVITYDYQNWLEACMAYNTWKPKLIFIDARCLLYGHQLRVVDPKVILVCLDENESKVRKVIANEFGYDHYCVKPKTVGELVDLALLRRRRR